MVTILKAEEEKEEAKAEDRPARESVEQAPAREEYAPPKEPIEPSRKDALPNQSVSLEDKVNTHTKIVVVSRRDGDDEIFGMNADGTEQTRLTNDVNYNLFPSWSPAMAQDWRTRVGLILRHIRCRGVDGFVLLGRHVAQGLVDTLTIVKHFEYPFTAM